MSSAQAQESSSTPSSTALLILSPSEEIDKTYKVPCDLTSDLERSTWYLSVTMRNLTKQLPSYESTTIVQANSSYFCQTLPEIKCNQVDFKKENKGVEDSKQFTSKYTAAMEALKPRFGAEDHFFPRSKDNEDFNAGNTSYTYIQEFFCSILTKVDSHKQHFISYNLKDILMIRELCDVKQINLWVKWGPSKYYLLKYFVMIPLSIVLEHQADTNMFCS